MQTPIFSREVSKCYMSFCYKKNKSSLPTHTYFTHSGYLRKYVGNIYKTLGAWKHYMKIVSSSEA